MSGRLSKRQLEEKPGAPEPEKADDSYEILIKKSKSDSSKPYREYDTSNNKKATPGSTDGEEGSSDGVLNKKSVLSEINTTVASIPDENLGRFLHDFRAVAADSLASHPKPELNQTADASLTWPSDKWKDASEKILGKKNGILTFLRRVWEPFIEKTGTVVTRETLATHDPDAERALTIFLDRHDMPRGISILYPKQVIKIISERPELAQAVLSAINNPDMR